MNFYYSLLGRLLEERTPIDKEGYFLLHENSKASYSLEKPKDVEVVSADDFVHALVEGCKVAVQSFASSPENKDVYVFNLYADEYNSIYIYMNTLDSFKKSLESYPKERDTYEINALKYNQGDFDFQLWQEHMGEYGRIIESFESLANLVDDLQESLSEDDKPLIAFEAGIIKLGYNVLVLKAVSRLISDNAFDSLNKTENFIAFAATGDDYIDYSIVMRKTIDPDLFYEIFPDIREKDLQFQETMTQNRNLSVGEFLDYWSDAVHSDSRLETPFTFSKSEIEVFLQLEHFGNALAEECIRRLKELINLENLERMDYERIYYYVEALHFSGKLTNEQKEECLIIANMMEEKDDVLLETSRELRLLN